MRFFLFSILLFFNLSLYAIPTDELDSLRRLYPTLSEVELAETLRKMGVDYKNAGEFNRSICVLNEAVELFVKQNDSVGMANSYNNLAVSLFRAKKLSESIKVYIKAIEINTLMGNKELLAKNYLNLGNLYYSEKYYDVAIQYYSKVAELSPSLENKNIVANVYNVLGLLHSTKDMSFTDYDKAFDEFNNAIEFFEKKHDTVNIGSVNYNISILFQNQGNYKEAVKYLFFALENAEKNKQKTNLIVLYNNIGNMYMLHFNDPLQAKKYFSKGLVIAKGSDDSQSYLNLLSNLLQVKMQLGENEDNIALFEELRVMRDSIYNLEKQKQLVELSTIYQTKQKDELLKQQIEISEAKSQTNTLLLILLILFLTSFVLVVLYIYNKLRFSKKLREREDRIHSNEMEKVKKEHEINSLNILISSQEAEQKRIAEDLHDRLGSKLAAVKLLLASDNEKAKNSVPKILTEIISEMREISHNLHSGILSKFGLKDALEEFLSKLDESGKYEVFFECEDFEPRLNPKIEKSIFYVIQELVANTIKHANATKISLQIIKYPDDNLNIIYEDNGVGFDFLENDSKDGIGLNNIKARLNGINGNLIIDSKLGFGCTFIIDVTNIFQYQPKPINK